MKKIKRIMAVLICMTITLTGIPVSVNAENSGGKNVQTMETGNELFITLEENTRYRWNVNDSAEKNSVVQKFLNKWTIFLFCSILFSSNQKEH